MSTQLFKVVTRTGVNVRTGPRLNAPKVSAAMLTYHDVLEVNTASRTESMGYEWWEHTRNPGWWSAARQIDPPDSYMIPYQPPHIIEPGEQSAIFEVMTNTLNVRSQPGLSGSLLAGQKLRRGERLRFTNLTEADGFAWWEQVQQPGRWAASGSLQGGQNYMRRVDNEIIDDQVDLDAVPWISQIQQHTVNLANDCGHACVWMVLNSYGQGGNHDITSLYAMPHKNPNGTTNNEHLRLLAHDATGGSQTLTTFNMNTASIDNFASIKSWLMDNRPVILLVWYPSLQFNDNPANGNFNHWVTLVGFSDNIVYLHDPLWTSESSGARREIAAQTLLQACTDTNMGLYGVY